MNTCCETLPTCCRHVFVLHVAIKALKRRWSIAANVKVAAYSLSIYSLALLHMQDANTSVSIGTVISYHIEMIHIVSHQFPEPFLFL